MNENLSGPEMIKLQRLRFGVVQYLSRSLLSDNGLDMQILADHLGKTLTARLTAAVYGRQTAQLTREHIRHVPVTWFDAWLLDTAVGRFLSRWRPVRERKLVFRVSFTRKELYPEVVAEGAVLNIETEAEFREFPPSGA